MRISVDLVDLVKSFLNLLFEQIANSNEYSNEYLLPKIGVDTDANEPLKV